MTAYNPYIRLVTESGKWSMYAPKHGKSIFSSLIPVLPSLPDVLTLSGSVGEILDEEWQAYLRLSEYIAAVRERKRARQSRVLGREYEEAPLPPVVLLYEVYRIAQILEMPVGWESHVHATVDSPHIIRLDHLMHMGEVVYNSGLYTSDLETYKPYRGAIHTSLEVQRKRTERIIPPWISLFTLVGYTRKYVSDEALLQLIEVAICGLVHNAVIRRDRGITIELEDVITEDVVPLLSRIVKVEGLEKYVQKYLVKKEEKKEK